jgi:hypothetical protein
LKLKILDVFLCDPYLCLSSLYLSHRLGESHSEVQQSARELSACGAFFYCETFAYSDLCCLSFERRSEETKRCLCLLRFALHAEPEFAWSQIKARDKQPDPD